MHAAIDGGIVDSATARTWLASLLEADLAGSYFCSVTVCVTVGRRSA
jgi:hypothetical protein